MSDGTISPPPPAPAAPSGGVDPCADTPMHMILRALDRRLRLVFPASQGFAHDFLPARITPKQWSTLTRRTPWVGLGWSGLAPDAGEGLQFVATAQFFLLLATRNAGGVRRRFTGDPLGPGLFNMVHLATVALQGYLANDPLSGFSPSGTTQVGAVATDMHEDFLDEDLALAQLQLTVRYEADVIPGLDEALGNSVGVLSELAIDWNLSGAQLADVYTPTGEAA